MLSLLLPHTTLTSNTNDTFTFLNLRHRTMTHPLLLSFFSPIFYLFARLLHLHPLIHSIHLLIPTGLPSLPSIDKGQRTRTHFYTISFAVGQRHLRRVYILTFYYFATFSFFFLHATATPSYRSHSTPSLTLIPSTSLLPCSRTPTPRRVFSSPSTPLHFRFFFFLSTPQPIYLE